MDQPRLDYRIWQRGSEWHWQVMSNDSVVLASGIEKDSTTARRTAFAFCLQVQTTGSEPN